MKAFTELFLALDQSNRRNEKLALLRDYFRSIPPADAAWGLYFLMGKRLKRLVRTGDLRLWAAHRAGLPDWLVEASYSHVGDLAETIALLLPDPEVRAADAADPTPPLHALVRTLRESLGGASPDEQETVLGDLWSRFDAAERFVLHKLLTGGFRVGVSRVLVNRALAEVASLDPAVVAHRLMGGFEPTEEAYRLLLQAESKAGGDPARPYPFYLAHPLEIADGSDFLQAMLGSPRDWQVEWKWDGIRAQLIHRYGATLLWSRGEEMVAEQFPELVEGAAAFPPGTVLDGEIVAWGEGAAQPSGFGMLQRRLGRKKVGARLRREVPVCFIAYDLLESEGEDRRAETTARRRARLEAWFAEQGGDFFGATPRFRLSPLVGADDWTSIAALRDESRARGVEGLMLKAMEGVYRAGRVKGEWWKWKVCPHTVDAVLVYAQQGHGRRAGLYTDYTFSIWKQRELVPFAKAYSGLSDTEIRRVDRWIRAHTREKHGPVRVVDPLLVFEIACDGITESKRHKSGIAARFPRIVRWREDKPAEEADTLERVRALLV